MRESTGTIILFNQESNYCFNVIGSIFFDDSLSNILTMQWITQQMLTCILYHFISSQCIPFHVVSHFTCCWSTIKHSYVICTSHVLCCSIHWENNIILELSPEVFHLVAWLSWAGLTEVPYVCLGGLTPELWNMAERNHISVIH